MTDVKETDALYMDNMKVLKLLVVVSSLCLALAGCTESSGKNADVLQIECDELNISSLAPELVDRVSYLALECPFHAVVGRIDEIKFVEDMMYVADYKSNKIFAYGLDGSFVGVLMRQGRGPGEYIEIQTFDVDDKSIYVLDNAVNKLIVYDRNTFQYVRESKLNLDAWDFEVLDNGGILFAYAPMAGNRKKDSEVRYRILVVDSDMNICDRYFAYGQDECDAFSLRHYLSESDGEILYSSLNEDGFHVFSQSDGSLKKSVHIKFANPMPSDSRSDFSQMREAKYTYQMRSPLKCGNIMAFMIAINGEGQSVLADQSMSFYVNSKESLRNNLFSVIGSNRDCLVADWQSSGIYDFMIDKGFDRAVPDVEALIHEDNPYLVFYHLK